MCFDVKLAVMVSRTVGSSDKLSFVLLFWSSYFIYKRRSHFIAYLFPKNGVLSCYSVCDGHRQCNVVYRFIDTIQFKFVFFFFNEIYFIFNNIPYLFTNYMNLNENKVKVVQLKYNMQFVIYFWHFKCHLHLKKRRFILICTKKVHKTITTAIVLLFISNRAIFIFINFPRFSEPKFHF